MHVPSLPGLWGEDGVTPQGERGQAYGLVVLLGQVWAEVWMVRVRGLEAGMVGARGEDMTQKAQCSVQSSPPRRQTPTGR